MPTFNGTTSDDIIDGSVDPDIINGDEGDDQLYGHGGNDEIYGDEGNDALYGGAGDDKLEGGIGNDTAFGGEGNDSIDGGAGDDTLHGGSGNDTINGGDGNDVIGAVSGGSSANLISNGSFEDGTHTANGVTGLDDWSNFTGSSDSADDGTSSESWNPNNAASDGTGYITMWGTTSGTNESIQQTLGAPLIAGTTYTISVDAISADNTGTWFTPTDIPVRFEILDTATGTVLGSVIVQGTEYENYTVTFTPSVDVATIAIRPHGEGVGSNPSVIIDNIALVEGTEPFDGTGDEAGDDMIDAGAGDDIVHAGTGNDSVLGGTGNDTIHLTSGNDTVDAGDDGDTIVVNSASYNGGEVVSVNGGEGGKDTDTLDLSDFTAYRNLTSTADKDGDSTSGTVEVVNADGNWITVNFTEIETMTLPKEEGPVVKTVTVHDAIELSGAAGIVGQTLTTAKGELVEVDEPLVFTVAEVGGVQVGDTVTIDGTVYTVSAATSNAFTIAHGGGSTSTAKGFQLTLDSEKFGELTYVIPQDSITALDDITSVKVDSSTPVKGIDTAAIDDDNAVSLDNGTGATVTVHDAIELSGVAGVTGQTLTTKAGELVEVDEPLVFNVAQPGVVLLGDTVTIDGTVYTVSAATSNAFTIAHDGGSTSTVPGFQLTLDGGKAGELTYVIPQDTKLALDNITSVMVESSTPVKGIDAAEIDEDNAVSLDGVTGTTVTVHDAIELSGAAGVTGQTLTTKDGELVEVDEPLVFNVAQPGGVQVGDTVTIDGTVYTVSAATSNAFTIAHSGGSTSTVPGFQLTLDGGKAGELTYVIPQDTKLALDDITSVMVESSTPVKGIDTAAIDDDNIVTLDDRGTGIKFAIYDAIELAGGVPVAGDNLTTANGDLVEIDEPLIFEVATAGQVTAGDTVTIDGIVYTVKAVNGVKADVTHDASTPTDGAIKVYQLVLDDGAGGQLNYIIPQDAAGNLENITEIDVLGISDATSILQANVDDDDIVTLGLGGTGATVTIHDAIELAGGAPGVGTVLTTSGGDLVEVDEPLVFSVADATQIAPGDTVTIDGILYTVSAINVPETFTTYADGTSVVNIKVVNLVLDDGAGGELNYLVPQDQNGALPDITEIEISAVNNGQTFINATNIDGNENVTLATAPVTSTVTIYDAIELDGGVPGTGDILTTVDGDLVEIDEPLVFTVADPVKIAVADTVTIDGVLYTVSAVNFTVSNVTYDDGASTTGVLKLANLVLDDGAGGQLNYLVQLDGDGAMPDITQIEVFENDPNTNVFVSNLDSNDNVTLATAPTTSTITIYDAIELSGDAGTVGETLTTANGDLVEVDEPLVFTVADPTVVQAGDTVTIDGIVYTVTTFTQGEMSVTHDDGATTTSVKAHQMTLVDGSGAELTYILPYDSANPLADITAIEIINSSAPTTVVVSTMDSNDIVTLAGLNYIVEGTATGDLIDVSYTGDPQGDMVDNNDHSDGSQDDSIEGYAGDDTIYAGLGDDTIDAGADNDTVYGEAGNDTVVAGSGDDLVYGGIGNDSISGGDGIDMIYGGDGNDTIDGDAGDDTIFGGAGEDSIAGGLGNDQIDGGADDDTIYGGAGEDVIEGGDGNDDIEGGDDNDYITGDAGGDEIHADAGDDVVYGGTGGDAIDLGDGNDVGFAGDGGDKMYGGAGDDQLFGDEPETVSFGSGAGQGGSNAGASSGPLADFPTDELTFEMQFNGGAMVTPGPNDPALTSTLMSYSTAGSPGEFGIYMVSDNEVFDLSTPLDPNDTIIETGYVTVEVNGVAYTTSITTNSMLDGTDQSISVTFDAATQTVQVFTNGTLADTITVANTDPLAAGGTLTLGNGSNGTGGFAGTIDEARLWDDIRTPGEINEFDDTGLGDELSDPNLVSDWLPDPFTGGLRDDVSNNELTTFGDTEVVAGAGAGNDYLVGGDGSDTVMGSGGDDVIYGDSGFTTTGAADSVYGGSGDDTVYGGVGNDIVSGGTGADTLFGGIGDDTIDASGTDGASDEVYGGDDRDYIKAGNTDVVDGGAGGDDFDTLDITGTALPGGTVNVVITGPDSNGNGFDGYVEYFDAGGILSGTLQFEEIESIIPCFTPGTEVATARGLVRVEKLRLGDRVQTRDNGFQAIEWLGERKLTQAEIEGSPNLQPILIRKGSLGDGLPARDMTVSPQHRMLVGSAATEMWFGESEVLVPATLMTCMDGIEQLTQAAPTYIHFMCSHHEVVYSDGTWSESFQPGDKSLLGLDNESRAELFELFPELSVKDGVQKYRAARPTLKKYEAATLFGQK